MERDRPTEVFQPSATKAVGGIRFSRDMHLTREPVNVIEKRQDL